MNQLAFAVALEAGYRYQAGFVCPMDRLKALAERLDSAWSNVLTREQYGQLMTELRASLLWIVTHRPEWVSEYARAVGR